MDLEVQMRTGRVAGVAGQSDDLAGLDGLADVDRDARHVSIAADSAVPVANLDHVAVPRLRAGKGHRACRHGGQGGADRDREVLAGMPVSYTHLTLPTNR